MFTSSVMIPGNVLTCLQAGQLLCGWFEQDKNTAIRYRMSGKIAERFLISLTRDRANRYFIFFGSLIGKPAEVQVKYWER